MCGLCFKFLTVKIIYVTNAPKPFGKRSAVEQMPQMLKAVVKGKVSFQNDLNGEKTGEEGWGRERGLRQNVILKALSS